MEPSDRTQAVDAGTASVSGEQFLKSLADSGLLSAEDIQAFLSPLPAPQHQDARRLAQELLKQQKLTRFQASMLLQGKVKGLVLGNYVILDKLGQGGMGMVFQARHRRMERVVALKVLSPAIVKNPSALQRFQREVKAAAKLSHPNIVAAHDADETKGVHFLVMEFVEGSDLSALVKKQGPMAVEPAVSCMLQAAHGLLHAHEAGIVHRDIKPANLLLDSKGTLKILDMGLARIDGAGNKPDAAPDELTQSGSIMGTCDYMAPEQALNTKKADRRADIYSLGCTLYYLLTGKAMFAGETMMEKMMAHQQDAIPPLPDVSKKLQAVYTRMVAKKVEDRYASMAEVIADLESCTKGGGASGLVSLVKAGGTRLPAASSGEETVAGDSASGLHTRPPRKSAKRSRLAGVAAAAVLLLAGLGWLLSQGNREGTSHQAGTGRQAAVTPTGKAGPLVDANEAAWLKAVAAMAPEKQVEAVAAKLKERNPGFDGKVYPKIEKGAVTELRIVSDHIVDIAPVRALRDLKILQCYALEGHKCKLSDLSPLKDMSLTALVCARCEVADLSPLRGTRLTVLNVGWSNVADLSPLQGMPITHIQFNDSPVADLTPLKGMPLELLVCNGTKVSDLTVLRGMPLTFLACRNTAVSDASVLKDLPLKELEWDVKPERDSNVLRSIKTLEKINGKPTAQFWKDVDAKAIPPLDPAWLKAVAAMPAEKQVEAVAAKLKERNPGFDGKIEYKKIEHGVVTELGLQTDIVTDIAPVQALAGLQTLLCLGTGPGKGKLTDLSPVKNMKVTSLACSATAVSDLAPLKGMKLTQFWCSYAPVSDLAPLKDMKLTGLTCNNTPVSDLAPLKGMKLTHLNCLNTKVTDLTVLKGMPLKTLSCDFKPERDAAILRSIETLETINGKPAAEFWKAMDAK